MSYLVIYDGLCNLCSNGVKLLEQMDGGQRFVYAAMQETDTLAQWEISPEDCELGMILIDLEQPDQRWQGSAAVEQIAHLLPSGGVWLGLYRGIPGMKGWGDRAYEQVRDHRYDWFGRRDHVYQSVYSVCLTCRDPAVPPSVDALKDTSIQNLHP